MEIFRRIHRNDSCACGSDKKFKKCCLKEHGKKALTKITISGIDTNKQG